MADPDYPDRPGYSFDPGPPREVTRYLRNKGLQTGFDWRDTEPEEHAVSFTVAKAMQVDLLEDIRREVQRAIDEGLPFDAFKRSLRPRLQARGWWGRAMMADPATGEMRAVQLGSDRRLRTIFDANLRTARAAGQWQRIQATKAVLPFLRYRLGGSETHRPHHADKAGTILPVDHPFWDEWMPPNGWGCNCWVEQIGRSMAERLGVSPDPVVPDRVWRNARTGEDRLVPQGIDPGWQTNPGRSRLQNVEAVLREKIAALPEAAARTALRDIATSWRVERLLAGEAKGSVPIAALTPRLMEAIGAKVGVVSIRDDVASKLREKHPDVTPEVVALFADAIHDGSVVRDDSQARPTLQVRVAGPRSWRLVIKLVAEADELWVSTIHRLNAGQWERILAREKVTIVRE